MANERPPRAIPDLVAGVPPWIWAAGLAPRLALFVLAAADSSRCLRGDSAGYLALADNLLRRRVFSARDAFPFSPETFRVPGYPLFLVPFLLAPHSVLLAALAQCLLGAATVALAWRWYERIGGARGAAVGALVLAFDPVTLFHTPLILSETLFVFLLVAASARVWGRGPAGEPAPGGGSCGAAGSLGAAAAGFLWGLCAFVKPIAVYLPPLLSWRWRANLRVAAAFLLGACLLPAAWTARNRAETGYAVFSSIGAHDLLRYPAAGVEALRTGRPWVEIDAELRGRVDAEHPGGYASDAEKAREYGRAASAILKAHPALLARYCAWGAAKVLAGTGLEMALEWTTSHKTAEQEQQFRPQASGRGTLDLLRRHPGLIPVQALYLGALAALYVGALLGLRRLWGRGQRADAALLLVCAGYFLGLAASQGYYRYRIPLMPFLAAGAAAATGRKKS